MNKATASNRNSARRLQSITLPRIEQYAPGPLNTVLVDKEGTLLYSDEINHSVVCLDHRGCLRWHKTGLGTGPPYKAFYLGAQWESVEAREEIQPEYGVGSELPGTSPFLAAGAPSNSPPAPSSALAACDFGHVWAELDPTGAWPATGNHTVALESGTSGKAGGLIYEPLKAVGL
jgi:hypothetical protein